MIGAFLGLLLGVWTAYIAQLFHLSKLQAILESSGGLFQLTILLPLFFIFPVRSDLNIDTWLGGAGLGLVIGLAVSAIVHKIYFESKKESKEISYSHYVFTGAVVGAIFIGLFILSSGGLGLLLLYPFVFLGSPIIGAILGGFLGYVYYYWVYK